MPAFGGSAAGNVSQTRSSDMNKKTNSTSPLNIALISDFSWKAYSGGGEKRYLELAKYLTKEGHNVTWVSMRSSEDVDTTSTEGINFEHIGSEVSDPPNRSIWNFFSFGVGLIWHLWKRKYDIVDSQTYCPLLFAYIATRFTKSKLIATIHDVGDNGSNDFFQFGRLGAIIENTLYRIPYKHIITVSEATKLTLTTRFNLQPDSIHVVYNGVSLAEIDRIPKQTKVRDLIYVGRLVPHKHIEDFIELCNRTQRSGAIIGQGPLESDIRQSTDPLVNIEFLGKLIDYRDVLTEIKKSEALVLPSTREGFGIVLVEAGACGLPVVAYATGGVSEVVVDTVTGFLVTPRDIDALCAAVELALAESNRQTMGVAGRNLVQQKFTWDRNNREVEQIYLAALGPGQ
jgi:glycosyltransferase involved in cell wall biosynthesis